MTGPAITDFPPEVTAWPAADTFTIGGVDCPGKATLISCTRAFEYDVRKAYGLAGGYPVPTGAPPLVAKFLVELWDEEQFQAWRLFAQAYLSVEALVAAGGTSTLGLGISHPGLNAQPINVTKVLVKSVSALEQDEYGLWSCEVEFLEFRPPAKVPARPLAAIPGVSVPKPTAKDAADREMEARSSELAAIAGP